MAAPKYIQRFARLPEVFERLAAYPNGLPLVDLAAEVGVKPDELREDLLVFFTGEPKGLLLGLERPPVLEFLSVDGDEDEPTTAEIIKITDPRPAGLGVEHLDPAELALIFGAAQSLLDLDPDDAPLREAVEVLTETMFGAPTAPAAARSWNRALEPLQDAVADRRRVRIVYSRTWTEGVGERVIDPYLLVQTRRGWEVDAGPPDADGRLRTYLLSNVRDFEILEETFESPAEVDLMLARQRTTDSVRVVVPHAARWAADFYAEDVAVVADDELMATLDLELLPPVDQRVGLLLLIAGEEAQVQEPSRLIAAGPALAAALLEHHRG
jgi:predicted DNA-binding transcriptional regulator YafY